MKKIYLITLLFPFIINAQNFQGPLSPSLTGNTSCPFSYSSIVDYLPAENAIESDDVYATASHCDCCDANTRCFETAGYGFTIPLTATIDGIVVEVEKKASGGSMVQDNGVKLVKAGTTVGLSQATTANWPSTDTHFTYGSATDLWGTTWLPEDINDSGFGLAIASISYTCFGNGSPVISSIDHVSITVYFTDIATSVSNTSSANANQLLVTPNPSASGFIQVSLPSDEKLVNISIADMTGKIHYEKTSVLSSGRLALNISLPKGTYTMHVNGSAHSYVKKFMVE